MDDIELRNINKTIVQSKYLRITLESLTITSETTRWIEQLLEMERYLSRLKETLK
jgi:hypothetical protein